MKGGDSLYRPDIDGLRAFAVLSVIVFHAFPDTLRGGFVGVDIFFVISGYLISSIIFQGLRDKSFSFSDFYARRIRRIFPALILVMSSLLLLGWFYLLPEEYEQLGKHTTAGAAFIENFVLRKESGYFDSELKLLLHLWSLAVEEQYYLLYPLLIWGAWRLKLNLLWVLAILFLCSLGINIARVHEHPEGTFYFPYTRFWELWAGAFFAYLKIFPGKIKIENPLVKNSCSGLGLVLLIVSILLIRKEFAFPGTWALLPVAGTCLMICAGESWINRKILSNRLVVYVGLISYPLYLWHWPLLTFGRIATDGALEFAPTAGILVLSFVLAALTWQLVEKPIRFGKKTKTKIICLVSLMVLLGVAGHYINKQDGIPFRFSEHLNKNTLPFDVYGSNPIEVYAKSDKGSLFGTALSSGVKASVLFIGDSNLEHYYPRVAELITKQADKTKGGIFIIGSGCFPAMVKYTNRFSHCNDLTAHAYEFIKNKPEIDSVVFTASLSQYFSKDMYLARTTLDGFEPSQAFRAQLLNKLAAEMKNISGMGKKTYLILNIPVGSELNPKKMLAKRSISGMTVYSADGIARAQLDKDYGETQKDLIRIAREVGAQIIDPKDILCNADFCPSRDSNGQPIYYDNYHLNPAFVRQQATFIDQIVQP